MFGKEKGPSIEELVTAEDVDILSYMGWEYEAEEEHVSSGELMLQEAYNEAKSSNSIASLERALDIAKEQVRNIFVTLIIISTLLEAIHSIGSYNWCCYIFVICLINLFTKIIKLITKHLTFEVYTYRYV